MIEADLEDLRGRRVAGDVAAELAVRLVGAHDHRERVPAHDRRDALLDREIAGIRPLLLERDRVAVRGVRRHVRDDAELLRLLLQLPQHEQRARQSAAADEAVERVPPLLGFARIDVRGRTVKIVVGHGLLYAAVVSSSRHQQPASPQPSLAASSAVTRPCSMVTETSWLG